MNFRKETIQEFNSYCDTTLKENMTFSEVVENIESANNNYFYVSMCKSEIIQAINNEKEITEYLILDNVCIEELGIYISLHP